MYEKLVSNHDYLYLITNNPRYTRTAVNIKQKHKLITSHRSHHHYCPY